MQRSPNKVHIHFIIGELLTGGNYARMNMEHEGGTTGDELFMRVTASP